MPCLSIAVRRRLRSRISKGTPSATKRINDSMTSTQQEQYPPPPVQDVSCAPLRCGCPACGAKSSLNSARPSLPRICWLVPMWMCGSTTAATPVHTRGMAGLVFTRSLAAGAPATGIVVTNSALLGGFRGACNSNLSSVCSNEACNRSSRRCPPRRRSCCHGAASEPSLQTESPNWSKETSAVALQCLHGRASEARGRVATAMRMGLHGLDYPR
mmetsp:Transcript_61502/g.170534  ORF Transcript_61502/g.170534 Transcript_61502/m.170534 type:complete len:214 (-) Transcript_61502:17-658(-)